MEEENKVALSFERLSKFHLPDHNPESEVEIMVSNPLVKDNLIKYVVYTIRGKDSTGTFEAYRRYKDFVALRKLLVRHWPGCLVPKLPQKQALGNLTGSFIEERRKLLEIFLIKSANVNYYYNSEEFRMFLRGPAEYHKSIANFRRQTFEQQAISYQFTFPNCKAFELNENHTKEIDEEGKRFFNNQTVLDIFHGRLRMCSDYFGYYKKEVIGLFHGLKDVNKQYLSNKKELELDQEQNDPNPYLGLLDWLRGELLDMGGMIEAFQKKNEYDKIKSKVIESIDNERKNIVNLQLDKKNLLQIISRKPKEHYIEKHSRRIQELESELKALEVINSIIAGHLLTVEIPKFKKHKSHAYEGMLKLMSESSIKQLKFIIKQTKKVEENLD